MKPEIDHELYFSSDKAALAHSCTTCVHGKWTNLLHCSCSKTWHLQLTKCGSTRSVKAQTPRYEIKTPRVFSAGAFIKSAAVLMFYERRGEENWVDWKGKSRALKWNGLRIQEIHFVCDEVSICSWQTGKEEHKIFVWKFHTVLRQPHL